MAYPQAWFQRNSKGQIIGSYSQVPIPKDGTPTWLPLVPQGTFLLEVEDGEAVVDIKREYLEELVSHFKSGFPGPAGVPVDQRGDHSRNPEGAYGFFTDVKIEDDGVWGLFEPTEYGKTVIAGGSLPYVSPVLMIGDGVDPVWGKSNILIDAALCSQPQFTGQPQMVLASAYAPKPEDTQAASAADSSHEGVSDMTPEEVQAMIDEKLAEAKATWEEEAKAATDALEAEKAELQAKIDELVAKADDAEALKTELDALRAKQQEIETAQKLSDAMREFEEIRDEVETVLPDGTKQTDVLALTKDAVTIAASAKAFPTAENTAALMAHLQAHGGFEKVTVTEGKPNLITASAPAGGTGLTAEQEVSAEAWTEECKAFVIERMGKGSTKTAAYNDYCGRLIPGL